MPARAIFSIGYFRVPPDSSVPKGPLYVPLMLDPSIFPLSLDHSLYANSVLVDSGGDGSYPAMSSLVPLPAGQSYSHISIGWAESSENFSPAIGAHEVEVVITSPGGDGWQITVPFTMPA